MRASYAVLASVVLLMSVVPSVQADHAATVSGGCNGGGGQDSEADVAADPSEPADLPDALDVVNAAVSLVLGLDPQNPTDNCTESNSWVSAHVAGTWVVCWDGDATVAGTTPVATDDGTDGDCQVHDGQGSGCDGSGSESLVTCLTSDG